MTRKNAYVELRIEGSKAGHILSVLKRRRGYTLSQIGEDLYEEFMATHAERGCSCHSHPPCSFCTHEGNPMNLIEQDDAWRKQEPWEIKADKVARRRAMDLDD